MCQEDVYFLELVRYIHLNPVRSGAVKGVEELDFEICGKTGTAQHAPARIDSTGDGRIGRHNLPCLFGSHGGSCKSGSISRKSLAL